MENKQPHGKKLLALSALLSLLCVGVPLRAQSPPAPDENIARSVQDNDTTRRELAQFNQFLDSHPEIAEQVRKEPSLLDKRDFVDTHPALQMYLQDHPGIRDDVRQNPDAFMRREDNFDRREDQRDINRARMDEFLAGHPETAEQVRKDPALLNDRDFVDHHPELQSFLQQQPAIRDKARSDPGFFLRQDDSFDRRPDDRDVNRARLDQFLDGHPEIAEQLRKDPSLLNNRDFVDHHPALESFLQAQPDLRDQLRTNPGYLRPDDFDRYVAAPDHDFDRGQLSSFRGFLDGHAAIAQDLSRNPAMAKDHDYVQSHPEFQAYLNANPEVRDHLMADPQNFVKSSQQFNANGNSNGWDNKTAPALNAKPKS